ncbi:glycosylated lysosomal membrane protein isoform X2 [Betta splendens]|nr:glycosylated lysosomal membrane protein isoform X2 [Betta splendens]
MELNPGSTGPHLGVNLLHIRAVGRNDTLHFLFCNQGAPTLLLVHTNVSSSIVTVNWTLFLARNTSGSLKIEPESSVLYSTAVVFSRLWEYNDLNDTADPTSGFFPPYELQDFIWSPLNLSDMTALLCGANATSISGSICFQLSVFEMGGRGLSWPHLLHTANSSQVKVWLDGMLPRANNSRFLLELQAVSESYPLSRVEVHQSIDDEYTPSVFKVFQWVSAPNSISDILGFVQWKPVAYRHSNPSLEDAMPCRHSDPHPQNSEAMAASSGVIRAFYSQLKPFGLNVSFGLAGDPFYINTKFLSWTVLVGIGSPPTDSFSPVVITIMAIGLGTPLVLVLLGGMWVCMRKRTMESTMTYEPIN